MAERQKTEVSGLDGPPGLEVVPQPPGVRGPGLIIWRKNRLAAIARAVEKWEARPLLSSGNPVSSNRVALEILAEQTNLSVAGIKKSFGRQKERESEAFLALTANPVDTLGTIPDPGMMQEAAKIHDVVKIARLQLTQVLVSVRQIHTRHMPVSFKTLEPMVDALTALHARLQEDLSPVSVCPYCKGLMGHIESCDACSSTGLANARELDEAPSELKDREAVRVHSHGIYEKVPAARLEGDEPAEEESVDDLWA